MLLFTCIPNLKPPWAKGHITDTSSNRCYAPVASESVPAAVSPQNGVTQVLDGLCFPSGRLRLEYLSNVAGGRLAGHLGLHAAVVWSRVTWGQARLGPASWRKDSGGWFSDEPRLGRTALAFLRKERTWGPLSNFQFPNSWSLAHHWNTGDTIRNWEFESLVWRKSKQALTYYVRDGRKSNKPPTCLANSWEMLAFSFSSSPPLEALVVEGWPS